MQQFEVIRDGGMEDIDSDTSLPMIVQDGAISKVISTEQDALKALGTSDIRYFPLSPIVVKRLSDLTSDSGMHYPSEILSNELFDIDPIDEENIETQSMTSSRSK